MSENNDIKIAVLEEQLRGIREQQKSHADTTKDMFTKLFVKIEELEAALNRGKGVFASALFVAGVIGGAITTGLHYLITNK